MTGFWLTAALAGAAFIGALARDLIPKFADSIFVDRRDRKLAALDRTSKHYERRVDRLDEVWRRLHEAHKGCEIMLPTMMMPTDQSVEISRTASQSYRDYMFENSRYFTQSELDLLKEFDRCLRRVETERQMGKIHEDTDHRSYVDALVRARKIVDFDLFAIREKIDAEFRRANPPDA